jgi:hypothetical protein
LKVENNKEIESLGAAEAVEERLKSERSRRMQVLKQQPNFMKRETFSVVSLIDILVPTTPARHKRWSLLDGAKLPVRHVLLRLFLVLNESFLSSRAVLRVHLRLFLAIKR